MWPSVGGRWVSAAAGGGRLRLQGAAAEGRVGDCAGVGALRRAR